MMMTVAAIESEKKRGVAVTAEPSNYKYCNLDGLEYALNAIEIAPVQVSVLKETQKQSFNEVRFGAAKIKPNKQSGLNNALTL